MCKRLTIVKITILICVFCLYGCHSDKEDKTSTPPSAQKNAYQEIKKSRVKFNFNQSFEIKEIKRGSSISDIHITGIGFQNSSAILKFENQNPIETYLIADIDMNGFEEFYIITRSLGSGAHGKLIGITSYMGKSYKAIFIPENDKKLNLNFEYLIGYRGQDMYFLKNMKLFRKFPVYKNTDIQGMPTEGERLLEYKLIEYEGSFTLQVDDYLNEK